MAGAAGQGRHAGDFDCLILVAGGTDRGRRRKHVDRRGMTGGAGYILLRGVYHVTGSIRYLYKLRVIAFMTLFTSLARYNRQFVYRSYAQQRVIDKLFGTFKHALLVAIMTGNSFVLADCPQVISRLHDVAGLAELWAGLHVIPVFGGSDYTSTDYRQ